MEKIKIGHDFYQGKDIFKLSYKPEEMPGRQIFSSEDIIVGNPGSNITIGFVYTWKQDKPPEKIRNLFQGLSNYAYITGYWRTTNGARYVFSNILANPNVNKLLLLVFGQEDNGHMLVDSLVNFWKYGTNENGLIKGSVASNPKFEQVTKEAEERIRKQVDLVVLRGLDENDLKKPESLVKSLFQEPENATELFKSVEMYSNTLKKNLLYDDGCRFFEPFILDLSKSSRHVNFSETKGQDDLGKCINAKNLENALEGIVNLIFNNGMTLTDQREIKIKESRSLSVVIEDPLEKIPQGYSGEYIEKYVSEFMYGCMDKESEFAYTYHERIFVKWGNQVKRAIELLLKNPNTRRCLISLWDPFNDLKSECPPCLNFIWLCIRNNKLEMHANYRSHHLATITKDGKLMDGEGAFVPNLYALGTLQKHIADKLGLSPGSLVLNDFSGHLYVSGV
ncbi:MAG: thymidylate synthase [Nanoarchaeota archaeon]